MQTPSDQRPDTERRKIRRLPRSVREQHILDAAIDVFAARGFHSASMDEISEVADISKPMIYTYLGSKDELLVACIRREAGRLIDAIGAAVDVDLRPEEQLWHGLRAFFDHVGSNRAGWTVLHRQAIAQGDPFAREFGEWRDLAMRFIATLLAQAASSAEQPIRPQQVAPFSASLVGACESLADWWTDHPEHTADGLAMRLMNLVWMGFGNLVEGRTWSPEPSEKTSARVGLV